MQRVYSGLEVAQSIWKEGRQKSLESEPRFLRNWLKPSIVSSKNQLRLRQAERSVMNGHDTAQSPREGWRVSWDKQKPEGCATARPPQSHIRSSILRGLCGVCCGLQDLVVLSWSQGPPSTHLPQWSLLLLPRGSGNLAPYLPVPEARWNPRPHCTPPQSESCCWSYSFLEGKHLLAFLSSMAVMQVGQGDTLCQVFLFCPSG